MWRRHYVAELCECVRPFICLHETLFANNGSQNVRNVYTNKKERKKNKTDTMKSSKNILDTVRLTALMAYYNSHQSHHNIA